jgi:hypothetical protein
MNLFFAGRPAALFFCAVTLWGHASAQATAAAPKAEKELASVAHFEVFKDETVGLWGVKNTNGSVVIAPKYKSAEAFTGTLAFIENQDGSVGLIDYRGRVVTPNVERAIWNSEPVLTLANMSEGLLAALDVESGKVGFVGLTGRWIIAPRFADAFEFREGMAAVRKRVNGKVGFIDKKGKLVIPYKFGTNFRKPPYFSEGLAAVGLNDNWPRTNLDPSGKLGYINKAGRWVISPIYSSGENFVNGKARVSIGEVESVITRNLKK